MEPALRSVLVATDLSGAGALALRRAALLPLAPDATLRILHVLPEGLPAHLREPVEAEAGARLREAVAALAQDARAARRPVVAVESLLAVGRPFEQIVHAARRAAADLIVIGRRGGGSLRVQLLGSTAERVVRAADAPVLVVRRPVARPYWRPLVGVDPQDETAALLRLALRVIGPEAALIDALHVYHAPFAGFLSGDLRDEHRDALFRERRAEAARRLRDRLAELGAAGERFRALVRRGDPRRVLLDEVIRRRSDLLVVGSHGRSAVARLLLGSVAETVVRAARSDVLVVRPALSAVEIL